MASAPTSLHFVCVVFTNICIFNTVLGWRTAYLGHVSVLLLIQKVQIRWIHFYLRNNSNFLPNPSRSLWISHGLSVACCAKAGQHTAAPSSIIASGHACCWHAAPREGCPGGNAALRQKNVSHSCSHRSRSQQWCACVVMDSSPLKLKVSLPMVLGSWLKPGVSLTLPCLPSWHVKARRLSTKSSGSKL